MPCPDCAGCKVEVNCLRSAMTQWFDLVFKEVLVIRDQNKELLTKIDGQNCEILRKLAQNDRKYAYFPSEYPEFGVESAVSVKNEPIDLDFPVEVLPEADIPVPISENGRDSDGNSSEFSDDESGDGFRPPQRSAKLERSRSLPGIEVEDVQKTTENGNRCRSVDRNLKKGVGNSADVGKQSPAQISGLEGHRKSGFTPDKNCFFANRKVFLSMKKMELGVKSEPPANLESSVTKFKSKRLAEKLDARLKKQHQQIDDFLANNTTATGRLCHNNVAKKKKLNSYTDVRKRFVHKALIRPNQNRNHYYHQGLGLGPAPALTLHSFQPSHTPNVNYTRVPTFIKPRPIQGPPLEAPKIKLQKIESDNWAKCHPTKFPQQKRKKVYTSYKPRNIVCLLCDKSFKFGRTNAISHAKIHLQNEDNFLPYFCKLCPENRVYRTAFFTKIKSHVKSAHKSKSFKNPGMAVSDLEYNNIVETKLVQCFGRMIRGE